MGRPPGSLNKMSKNRDAAARLLAEQYGDPLEDILLKRDRWQSIYDEQMAKPSRHRNVKKLAEAEEKILRYNIEALPYMRPRYQAINHSGDAAPVPSVIRAPETIPDSQAWLEAYAPKRDDMANDRPPASPALRPVIDTLKALDHADDVIANLRDKRS